MNLENGCRMTQKILLACLAIGSNGGELEEISFPRTLRLSAQDFHTFMITSPLTVIVMSETVTM